MSYLVGGFLGELDERSIAEARLPQHAEWEPVRLIGAGGMADVYEVVDTRGEWSAVKVLTRRDGAAEQANAEYELTKAAREASAAVVRMDEVGVLHDGRAYLRMELLQGKSLEEAWTNGTDIRSATRLVTAAARAMQPVHLAGLVHCDLKPENIFVESGGRVRLVDFGLSLDGAEDGEVVGTLRYSAPELVTPSCAARPTPQSDVYSLGAVLYEGICGVRPFSGATYPAILLGIHSGSIIDIRERAPQMSEALAKVVRCAMHLDPAERFASMKDFADALDRASAEDSTPPGPRPIQL